MTKSVIHKTIAKNIARIRNEKGLTQEALAYQAGLNRAYIGYIERGERKPTVETLEKIAKCLKIKVNKLLE